MMQFIKDNWMSAKFWQSMAMLLVCCSFIYANVRHGAAYDLWNQSPEAFVIFLGLGVGMKMTKDVAEKAVTMKYKSQGRISVDDPDKGI